MDRGRRLQRRLNKKGSELVLKNTVEAILFLLLFIVVIIILRTWWNAYQSQGSMPALISLDGLQKAIDKLDPEYMDITRTAAIQTNNYLIRGYVGNLDLCGEQGGEALNCICVCESDTCEFGYKDPNKNCRIVKYKPESLRIEQEEENVINYVVRLTGSEDDPIINIAQSG